MNQTYCMRCMQPLKANEEVCPHCGQTSNPTVPAHHLMCGTVLKDKYYVGKALGEGGFGITYIGRDLTLDVRIAIKEYYPNGYANRSNRYSNEVTMTQSGHGINCKEDIERFLKEARSLARFIDKPGVVGVRDFFRENGTAYIVMEYLDGITMKKYIGKYGPIPPEDLFPMIDPILQTLGDIHKVGLIHRDISPDNIMILKNGQLKLLDFGAAREVTADKSLSVVLKHGYAPEEQYRAKGKQGSWTDVYAMCATIYMCLTGKTPDDSIQRVFEDTIMPPSKLGVAISACQETALMKGLCVKSSDRIQTMDDLRRGFLLDKAEDVKNIHIHRSGHIPFRSSVADTKTEYLPDEKTVFDGILGNETVQQGESNQTAQKKGADKPDKSIEQEGVAGKSLDQISNQMVEDPHVMHDDIKRQNGERTKTPKNMILVLLALATVALSTVAFTVVGAAIRKSNNPKGQIYPPVLSQEKQQIVAFGECCPDVQWELDVEGNLTIKGKGSLSAPGEWGNLADQVNKIYIQEGITSICDLAFANLPELRSVTIPASVERLGNRVFWGSGVKTIEFEGNLPELQPRIHDNTLDPDQWNDGSLHNVSATVYYVCDDPTIEKLHDVDYGGSIEWVITLADGINASPIYRLFHYQSSMHYFTGSAAERDRMVIEGWYYEGLGWYAPTSQGNPVYCLYHSESSSYRYVADQAEMLLLLDRGWKSEGICWYSAEQHSVPVYGLFDPNRDGGQYHYTCSIEEYDSLIEEGWQDQGIAWYALSD